MTAGDLVERGAFVSVTIRAHPNYESKLRFLGLEAPSMRISLLVDTGARYTTIDLALLETLNLEIGAAATTNTAAGAVPNCPIYHAMMTLHLDDGPLSLGTSAVGLHRGFAELPYRGLLGRNVLRHTRFVYDGPAGTFEIRKP